MRGDALGTVTGRSRRRRRRRIFGLSLLAALVFAGAGCSSVGGSDATGGPSTGQGGSATPSAEPATPEGGSDLRRLCDRFEVATGAGDREAVFETITQMAAGEDPRPESHESFFGSDRKIWLWAQLAARADEERDRPVLRLAIERIHVECANVE